MGKERCWSPWEDRASKEGPFSEVRRLRALGHRLRAGCWEQGGGREQRWTLVTQVHPGRKQACRDVCGTVWCTAHRTPPVGLLSCVLPLIFDTQGLLEACCRGGPSLGTLRRSSEPISVSGPLLFSFGNCFTHLLKTESLFLFLFMFNRRIVALQCCVGFCHVST